MACLLVLSNFPDNDTAKAAATALVEEQLAACVNLLPGVTSIYRWKGNTECANEVTALIKTTDDAFPKLQARLLELHPYEVPEIIALPIEAGLESYLSWVKDGSTLTGDERRSLK
ncbi:MAG: divalent-cation tolerance protein CutA [Verrucomicrobia bacterium]|nr:divalent-cation tolerance protein CutA [Verrucomicrobiota bacterium]